MITLDITKESNWTSFQANNNNTSPVREPSITDDKYNVGFWYMCRYTQYPILKNTTNKTYIFNINITMPRFYIGLSRTRSNGTTLDQHFANHSLVPDYSNIPSGDHTVICTIDNEGVLRFYFDGEYFHLVTNLNQSDNNPFALSLINYTNGNTLILNSLQVLDYCLTEHEIETGNIRSNNSGKYVVYAEYSGNELYAARRSKLLFLQGVNPHLKIEIDPIEVLTYNETNTITGTVKTQNNNALPYHSIKLVIETPNGTEIELPHATNDVGEFSIDYTPTSRGGYKIQVMTEEDQEYSKSSSDPIYVLTDSLSTTTTLTSDNEQIVAGHTVSLTAKVKDSSNTPAKGVTVEFYDGNNLLGSTNTNSNGEAIAEIQLDTVKTYSITAKVVANSMYTTSTSSAVSVSVIKHTLSASLLADTIYIGWTAKIRILDEDNNPVTNTAFNVSIGGESQTLLTDSTTGTLTTPVFSSTGTKTIIVSRSASTDYNALSSQFFLKINGVLSVDSSPSSVSNNQTKIPYKIWENLGNTRIANDGNYTVCGTNCTRNVLGGKNGSWNTPAPLKFSNLGLNIPNNADLDSLEVYMVIRTLSCSSDTANIGISAPTVSMLNKNVLMELNTGNGRLPFKSFGTVKATIDLNNITVEQLNNSNTYFVITFPKNSTTNTGRLQIDHVYVKVNYTPSQEG